MQRTREITRGGLLGRGYQTVHGFTLNEAEQPIRFFVQWDGPNGQVYSGITFRAGNTRRFVNGLGVGVGATAERTTKCQSPTA